MNTRDINRRCPSKSETTFSGKPVTFFYLVITANDLDEAHDHLQVCLSSAKRSEAKNLLAFVSPPEDEEELPLFVFAVFDVEVAIDAEDMLHDCFDVPHLVNAALYDEDDF